MRSFSKRRWMVSERPGYHLTLLKILGEYRIDLKIAQLCRPGCGSGERKEKGNGRDQQPWKQMLSRQPKGTIREQEIKSCQRENFWKERTGGWWGWVSKATVPSKRSGGGIAAVHDGTLTRIVYFYFEKFQTHRKDTNSIFLLFAYTFSLLFWQSI